MIIPLFNYSFSTVPRVRARYIFFKVIGRELEAGFLTAGEWSFGITTAAR